MFKVSLKCDGGGGGVLYEQVISCGASSLASATLLSLASSAQPEF